MKTLSVAIITLNEEEHIRQCMEAVLPIADEIIMVDSGSTDRTVAIAESLGAKVFIHEFRGYVEQKNLAFASCNSDFIFSLDADEIPDEDLIHEIKKEKEKGFSYDGYWMKRLNYIGKKPIKFGVWKNDKQLRLVKKSMANWEGAGVHERLIIHSTNTLTFGGKIHHYSFQSIENLFDKTITYAELAATHLHESGIQIAGFMVPVKAFSRFVKHFFIKGGFIHGYAGWMIGKQQYFEALWKYRKLREFNRNSPDQ